MAAATASPGGFGKIETYDMEKLGFYFEETGNWLKDQLQVEMMCFRLGHSREFGGRGKFGHFKQIVDLLWNNPALDCPKKFVWNSWAERMLREACEPGCEELGVAGPTSAGKCISPLESVLLHNGRSIKAGDVKPGDVLMGDDSGPRVVQEVHRGRGPMYRIIPERGDPWECSGSHTLVLKRTFASKKSWRRVGDIVEIEVEDYLKKSKEFRRSHKQFCVGVDFPHKDVEFDPRLLGLWLGDGHLGHCRISIPDSKKGVLDYVQKWAEEHGYVVTPANGGNPKCPSYQISPIDRRKAFQGINNHLRQFFISCVRQGEKRIPEAYLTNSKGVRMQVLAGLLDTDGYADKSGFEISTKYVGLKDDIVFLARSLGFRVSARFHMAKCGEKEFPAWRIFIAGDCCDIPTFQKKCGRKTLRKNSDCVGFQVEPLGEGEWVGFSVDGNHRHLLADFTVTHNSDPFALWAAVNYMVDPTHVKVLIMSTTIQGAKLRIWKTFTEYVRALPEFPGKPVWSSNLILGPSYDQAKGFGEGSGVQLLASEKSKEKDALEKMIGIKSPRTGEPDYSMPALMKRFADLVPHYHEHQLEDLLPRMMNLLDDRIGKLILVVDEATGLPESLLNIINLNMKPGNGGSLQTIFLGNPALHYDSFGLFCEPAVGWENVSLNDDKWETKTGGTCIRFNGEENPRLTEKNDRYSWMLTQARIDAIARDCGGKTSLGYYRMVLGMWSPEGSESGVYTQADVESHGAMAMTPVIWGNKRPIKLSSLDCAFTADGDRAFVTFGKLGVNSEGLQILEITETQVLVIDLDSKVPVNLQIIREWKRMCEERGIPPFNCCYDSSGAGVVFGDMVAVHWSSEVMGITASGSAIEREDTVRDGMEVKFTNRATQIWYSAHPFFRSGQIKGVTKTLAKEICSRKHDEGSSSADGRTLKIESKRIYKRRTGQSPDESDSFFQLVEHCRIRHGFKPAEKAIREVKRDGVASRTWEAFKSRARRITHKKNLN